MTNRIGAHVDPANPLDEARMTGLAAVQFPLGSMQTWKAPTVAYEGGADALKADASAADVELWVHSAYLINVASPNNRVRIPSRKLLQSTLNLAAEIGAQGVVVHGGHVTSDDDPQVGFDNWFKCIDRLDLPVPLLIENTAGGANAMARKLDRIEGLWETISKANGFDQVGFCLDTCHAHAGGIDLTTVVDTIMGITGRIDLVHCNDSRDAAGTGADRHANLGQGQIDPEGLLAVLKQVDCTIMLETPGGIEGHIDDLAWLKGHGIA